jgi:ABC-type branched-subunit amino acid transport system substrate-binding protein
MRMRMALAGIISLAAAALSGQTPEALLRARQALLNDKSNEAVRLASPYAEQRGAYQSAALFLMAKGEYRLAQFDDANKYVNRYITAFSGSDLDDDAYYLRGKIYYQLNQYPEAVKDWLFVLEESSDANLRKLTSTHIAGSLDNLLSDMQISRLRAEVKSPTGQAILSIREAKNALAKGQKMHAKRLLLGFVDRYPANQYVPIAEEMLAGLSDVETGKTSIAAVLPLSGYNEDIGRALGLGLQFALQAAETDLEIQLYDQNTAMLGMLETIEDVSNQPNVLGIVGPIDNQAAAAAAAMSRLQNIPIVSPTAGEEGIAAFSDYMFQLTPDYAITATKLANYAVYQMQIDTFAILAPLDTKGMGLAKAFRAAVEKAGGVVLSEEYFYPDAESYKEQFMRIRRRGLFLQARDTLLQKYPGFSDSQLDSVFKLDQEAYYEENPDVNIDSLDFKVEIIEGMFIPIYPADLVKMTSQFAFYNIRTTLLGNDGWLDSDHLQKNRVLLPHGVFATSYYYASEGWDFRTFKNRFRTAMGVTPGFFEVLGYDAGRFLINAAAGAGSRDEYRARLAASAPFQGLSLNIRFGPKQRVNEHVKILEFKSGQLLQVE